mmetsp:Transcript_60067/g.106323  ORF Transcript_60067/g.106323 Transcript_60067/m.106323 type:complete len:160 (+) Transcript_60067:375-854(+)
MDVEAEQILEGSLDVPSRIVISAEKLANGLSELEWGSETGQKDKRVAVGVQVQPPQLSMTVSSEDLGCEMVFPQDALIVCNIRCDLEFSYRFSLLRMALRSLQQAEEACIQLDVNGLFDLKVKFANAQFIQFFIHPLMDEEEDFSAGINASTSNSAGNL